MKQKFNNSSHKYNSNPLKIFMILFLTLIISTNSTKAKTNTNSETHIEKQMNYKDLYEDVK